MKRHTAGPAHAGRVKRSTTYAIEVRGPVPAGLTRELAAFSAHVAGTTTVLTGPIADTAALYGLLVRLESVGVALVSARPVTDPTGGNLT